MASPQADNLEEENERLKFELSTLRAAERKRLWDETPDDGDRDQEDVDVSNDTAAATSGIAAAPDDADVAPSVRFAVAAPAASSRLGHPRTVRFEKTPSDLVGIGLSPGRGGAHAVITFVKKDSLLRGQLQRGECLCRINGEAIVCKREADAYAIVKRLNGMSGTIKLRIKPTAGGKRRGGCCGAARPDDGSDEEDSEEDDEDFGFGGADDDGDGLISRNELVDQLEDAGVDVDEQQAAAIIAALDTDGDGMLSAEEYKQMDADGDGVVSAEELASFVSEALDEGPMPEPPAVGALLQWKGTLYVAIRDPAVIPSPHGSPLEHVPLAWTPAPMVSPTGHATHEQWRLSSKGVQR